MGGGYTHCGFNHDYITLHFYYTCSSHWTSSQQKSLANTTCIKLKTMVGSVWKSRRECMIYPKWGFWLMNCSPNDWPPETSTHTNSLQGYGGMSGNSSPLFSLLMTLVSNKLDCSMHGISWNHSNKTMAWLLTGVEYYFVTSH